jgi:hypothetical protein
MLYQNQILFTAEKVIIANTSKAKFEFSENLIF